LIRLLLVLALVIPDVPYRTVGDLTLTLDIHSNGPGPAVILVHGGAWRDGDKSQVSDTAEALAAEGFVVFNVNYRLACQGSEPICGYLFPAAPQDVKAAFKWVRQHGAEYGVLGGIGIVGTSAGGNLAAMVAGQGGTRPDAVVAWSGAMDMTAASHVDAREQYIGCSLEACPETWHQASPITHVDRRSSPLYLSSGELDPLVPPWEQQAMVDALLAVGVEATSHIVPDSGCHARNCYAKDPAIWTETVEFLHTYLDLGG
jgi:acetyl esterase/lipase